VVCYFLGVGRGVGCRGSGFFGGGGGVGGGRWFLYFRVFFVGVFGFFLLVGVWGSGRGGFFLRLVLGGGWVLGGGGGGGGVLGGR